MLIASLFVVLRVLCVVLVFVVCRVLVDDSSLLIGVVYVLLVVC